MTKPNKPSNFLDPTNDHENDEYKTGEEPKDRPPLVMEVGGSWISIRIGGDSENCGECGKRIEVFSKLALKARFLIIRDVDRIFLGGGRCLECDQYICLSCAAKTIYGKGMWRLHCPHCGILLSGLRRTSEDSTNGIGAFLEEPDFGGKESEETQNTEKKTL